MIELDNLLFWSFDRNVRLIYIIFNCLFGFAIVFGNSFTIYNIVCNCEIFKFVRYIMENIYTIHIILHYHIVFVSIVFFDDLIFRLFEFKIYMLHSC